MPLALKFRDLLQKNQELYYKNNIRIKKINGKENSFASMNKTLQEEIGFLVNGIKEIDPKYSKELDALIS